MHSVLAPRALRRAGRTYGRLLAVLLLGAIGLLAAGCSTGVAGSGAGRNTARVRAPETLKDPAPAAPATLDKTYNILVMGVDHRAGYESWRTDSIMVVAVDLKAGQVGVISIPRDLYVEIPGKGMGRINEVDYLGEATGYPGGGPALLAKVVNDELGIPTKHYARIQMDGLVRLVDALGGVTVNLDCPLTEATPDETSSDGLAYWSLPAGANLLDGATAKKFATYRYLSNDIVRIGRQQQLIWAIRNRALQIDAIPRIPELWKALSDTFETDLKPADAITLARVGVVLEPANVHSLVLIGPFLEEYTTEEGSSVLRIADGAGLNTATAGLFAGAPLSELGKSPTGDCQ